jgi:hypothetical protein
LAVDPTNAAGGQLVLYGPSYVANGNYILLDGTTGTARVDNGYKVGSYVGVGSRATATAITTGSHSFDVRGGIVTAATAATSWYVAVGNALLNCTAAWQDVSGASVTVSRAGYYLVLATFAFVLNPVDISVRGTINVGGIDNATIAESVTGGALMVTQTWVVSVAASGVIKLRGQVNQNNSGGNSWVLPSSTLRAVFIQ